MRYELEPYIRGLVQFEQGHDNDVLESGVGMAADHVEWAKSQPRSLTGVDLTSRAIEHTRKRMSLIGLESQLQEADAESLPFQSESFDVVYSWGVIHHSPDTQSAVDEVFRVLRPGGIARIMIYHKYSLTGYMLWFKYGLLAGKPLTPLTRIYAEYLESPGTKAYTVAEATRMFAAFSEAAIRIQLNFGDLLEGAVGQRHRGILLSIAKKFWPRRLAKRIMRNHGLMLLIEARK